MNPRLRMFLRAAAASLFATAFATTQQFAVEALASPQPRVIASGTSGTQSYTIQPGPVTETRTIRASTTTLTDTTSANLSVVPSPSSADVSASVSRQSTLPGASSSGLADGGFDVVVSGTLRGSLLFGFRIVTDITPDLRIDVLADGRPELHITNSGYGAGGSYVFPVNTTGSIRTRITFRIATGSSGLSSTGSVQVAVRFVPSDSIAFRIGEPGCGPAIQRPVLFGSDTRTPTGHRIELRAVQCFASAPVAMVFGVNTVHAPLPLPGGCSFMLEPVNWSFLTADAAGTVSVAFDLPQPLVAATVYMQAIPFDSSPRAYSSNRLDVVLVP